MLVLLLDTATPAVTAALARIAANDVELCSERVTVAGRAHGELLAPQIAAAFSEVGAAPADLGAIVAGVGPGPFTGLRVGLMTAATMSFSLGIPAYGVGTLDALGAAAKGLAVAATDARRREVYWALYEDGVRRTAAAVGRPADVAAELAARGALAGVGEGVQKYAEVLGIGAGEPLYPPAIELARLAADRVRAGAPGEPLTPLYLRRPDAVERAAR